MIECTDKNIWYVKKRRFKRKRRFVVLLIFIILLVSFIYYHTLVCKEIFNHCINYSYSYSNEAVNEAVLSTTNDGLSYNDLISIDKNSNGDIALMSVNSIKANLLNKKIAIETTNILKEKLKNGIPIPWLAFTGISVLSGYGNSINFKTANVSSVNCEFRSSFKSVGLNQTLHSIYIDVICDVNFTVPFNAKNSKCTTSVLISETVLIGKVPETYLNGKLFN